MSGSTPRRGLYLLLTVLFLVRYDLWLWNNPKIVLGLPVGLTYHVVYCLVTAVAMALLVRFAWPAHLDSSQEGNSET